MWHVSFRSSVATLPTAIHLLLTRSPQYFYRSSRCVNVLGVSVCKYAKRKLLIVHTGEQKDGRNKQWKDVGIGRYRQAGIVIVIVIPSKFFITKITSSKSGCRQEIGSESKF